MTWPSFFREHPSVSILVLYPLYLLYSTTSLCHAAPRRDVIIAARTSMAGTVQTEGSTAPTTPTSRWLADATNYPDPRRNPVACGRTSMTDHGFICDPDATMDYNKVISINSRVLEVTRRSKCTCTQCFSVPDRSSIAVALVNNLQATYTGQNASAKILQFADNLRRLNWKSYGNCDNNLVIAFNMDEKQLFVATGPNIRRYYISNTCLTDIITKTRHHFDDGRPNEGILELLDYFANALQGGRCGTKSGLSVGQIAGIVVGVISGVAAIIGLIVCCVGFCQDWECVVDTCIGVCIGCVLGCIQGMINALIVSCIRAVCDECGCGECCECECEPLDCINEDGGFESSDGGGGAGTG